MGDKELIEKNKELLEKHEILVKKHGGLVQQLRDKVECPVCLDVPKKAPIPVCPNGHIVCSKCVRVECPKCRVRMGQGKSTLAVTVIENIEHQCENDECQKKFSLEELAKHVKICDYRLVNINCPGPRCNEKVSLALMATHIVSCYSVAGFEIKSFKMPNVFCYAYDKSKSRAAEINFVFGTMKFDENLFLLKISRHDVNGSVRWLFVVQMVGSEEEAEKYGVTIVILRPGEKPGGKYSLSYCGDICWIDVTSTLAAEERGLGITLGDGVMKKFLVENSDSVGKFSVSVDLRKEKL